MRRTPKWLSDFREAYRHLLPEMKPMRDRGLSWEDVRRELEPRDKRLSGQNHQRWRNEWWLAAKDGARPKG